MAVSEIAEGQRFPKHEVSRNSASLTPISWAPDGDVMQFSEWVQHGRRLGVLGRGVGWWIGDWLLFGNLRYGERYVRASRITGYDPQTLMNMVYVASHFEISRRRENLSWSHHAELAGLNVPDQDRWLDRAEEQRLSVRDLREAMRNERKKLRAAEGVTELHPAQAGVESAEEPSITCPRCGLLLGGERSVHSLAAEAGGAVQSLAAGA